MGKIKGIAISILLATILVISTCSCSSDSAENILNHSKEQNLTLSGQKYEQIFTDQKEIEAISEEYGLSASDKIEQIIYVPLQPVSASSGESSASSSLYEFYVKAVSSGDMAGSAIRSSTFESPGGTMKVNQGPAEEELFQFSAAKQIDSSALKKELEAAFGFSDIAAKPVGISQQISVQKNCRKNVKAYLHLKTYDYELWEKDVKFDDYYGKGSVKRPVGVIFEIGKNLKK